MLVPDLVDDVARRDRHRRDDGEKAEAAVGVDRGAGLLDTPAMVARQSAGEIQRRIRLEIMLFDAPPQLPPGGGPDGLVRLDIDLELHALLQPRLPMISGA